jgi:quercetin dioxygenase-like cupin family protein
MDATIHDDLKPYMVRSGEGVNTFDASVKASRISTGGRFTFIESHTKGGAPLHVHSKEDEYLYVIKGKIIVSCGEEVFEAEQGSFIFLPRNIPHSWDVVGDIATILMMTVPAMLEEFLSEFHKANSKETKNQVAVKYGITFL